MLMIERIAQAIAEEQGSEDWRDYLGSARAAVQALREPSVDMLERALPNLPDWGFLPDDWASMLDHVVQEYDQIRMF